MLKTKQVAVYKSRVIYQRAYNWFQYRKIGGRMSPKSFATIEEVAAFIDKMEAKRVKFI